MDEEYKKQLEAQRVAFEAQFGTLESLGFEDATKTIDESEDEASEAESSGGLEDSSKDSSSDESSDDSFQGFSEQEQEQESGQEAVLKSAPAKPRQPRVIKFEEHQTEYKPTKKEQMLIRGGRAPTLHAIEKASQANADSEPEDSDLERDNLKKDIELQRFLKESHLISAFQTDKDTLHDSELHGKARARTLETRLQSLSDVNAVQQRSLESMPMGIRKGMVKKHTQRITKYEQDARDAGTVLSRVSRGEFRRIDATYKNDIERRIGRGKNKSQNQSRGSGSGSGSGPGSGSGSRLKPARDFGLKIHSVGRSTRNGLKLSAADIAKIKGK